VSFPMMRSTEAMLAYCRDWVNDANDRMAIGHRTQAQESLRTAMSIYVQLPAGYSDPEFEKYYQETSKKVFGTL
jgi:hypothetical protein